MMANPDEFSEGSSSSLPAIAARYDVFLSFRGTDTRRTFTAHLHLALQNANIETFLDDAEIPTGEKLRPELESAIKGSRASVIVLSENYAYSRWCLDELVLILAQKRKSSHKVIPIFYHVEPTDINNLGNTFGDAESNLEKRIEGDLKMGIWKKALLEVANLEGHVVKLNGRLETEIIEEVITDIEHHLDVKSTLAEIITSVQYPVDVKSTFPNLIGVDYHVRFITSWLKDGSTHTADILTISGMSGMGKTSLARYIYKLHSRLFQRSSFIDDINRKCQEKSNSKLLDLQKQLCGDVSKASSVQVNDVSVYTSEIEHALARKKVLLVLDDVCSLNQLNALLGDKGFHLGSKIIITTKDAEWTKSYKLSNPFVQPNHTMNFLKGLNETSSLKLLSFHAFKHNDPKVGYKQVSKKLVHFCERRPLALEVLGSSLCGRDVAVWEEYIEGLNKETGSRLTKVLRMSFDSLPSQNDKELFKHIACFFVGEDRDSTETILKACGISTVLGIKNLRERCLLTIGPRNEFMMHQLLQEMGRDVVRQESVDQPRKRSRLWHHEDIFNVLKQKKGAKNLLGLALDMRMLNKDKRGSFELKTDTLSKMDNLMLLQLNYVQIIGSYENFPKELRWLCMHGFPLKSIPLDSPMENLVVLNMSYSNIESFDMSFSSTPQQPQKLLGSLKILDLGFCEQLHSLGGFHELPALERLIVRNCITLIEVCESIEQCVNLVLIDRSYCNKLGKLPTALDKLKKLKILNELPIEKSDVDSPETFNVGNISTEAIDFPSIFSNFDPRYLRKQSSSFQDAKEEHKQRMEAETNSKKRSKWTQVAYLMLKSGKRRSLLKRL